MKKKYIIGLGNYSKQDDSIGLRIVEDIVAHNLDKTFDAVDVGNDGVSMLGYFSEETERILMVDCALINKKPGDYLFCNLNDIESRKVSGSMSTHEGDIIKIVEMARSLNFFIPPIRIMAIQPESLDLEMTLSNTLMQRLDKYVRLAVEEINK
ncbi:hydrogenase maturation protease [Verrucomicrobiota bacterium]